jgi:hypothetical protein
MEAKQKVFLLNQMIKLVILSRSVYSVEKNKIAFIPKVITNKKN